MEIIAYYRINQDSQNYNPLYMMSLEVVPKGSG